MSSSFWQKTPCFDSLSPVTAGGPSGGIRSRLREMAHVLQELPQGFLRLRRGGDMLASFQAEWCHLFNAIRNNTPVECTLEDGRRALRVVLAAARSTSCGRPVKIAEVSEL